MYAVGVITRVSVALRDKPNVVHLNCGLSPLGLWRDLAIARLVRLRGAPLIVHYHGSLPDVFRSLPPTSRIALKALIRRANRNVGITRESVSLLERLSGRPAVFLPNFVDDRWLDVSVPASTDRSRLRAIYVGTCSSRKGALDLLEAARQVPAMDFLLVGDPRGDVEAALASPPANVKSLPAIPRRGVMDLLRDSDVFVFPSRCEGFPNAVLEAMAAGLPVVASRVGAVGEMLDEGRGGHLVAPGDVSGLVDALRELAASRELRMKMGASNRRRCEAKYRFSTVFVELRALYEGVAAEDGGATTAGLAKAVPASALPGPSRVSSS